jgi:hypothetical protein
MMIGRAAYHKQGAEVRGQKSEITAALADLCSLTFLGL